MKPENHVTDQLAAYALNILDVAEAEQVAAHLATCSSCQETLHAYREVTGLLALAAPEVTPPATLKQRLLQDLREPDSATAVTPARPSPSARSWLTRWRRWFQKRPLWQPVLVLVLIILLISNFQLRQQLGDATNPAGFGTITLTGTEVSGAATGIIIISSDGEHGTLVVQDLPVLQETEAYQLWLVKEEQRTSGAVFNVDEDGYRAVWLQSPDPLASYERFGITIEPAGGSPGPTGDRVLGN